MKKNDQQPGQEEPKLVFLELKSISPSKLNPRKDFDEPDMVDLTASVLKHGIIQPITVRPKGKGYEIVCGERRYRAALTVNSEHETRNTIPASIRNLSDEEALELMVTENLQRKDVHPLEEAAAFQIMLDKMHYTLTDIAAKIGKNEPFVVRRLQLQHLGNELKKIFRSGELPIGHAELLSRIDDKSQKMWFDSTFKTTWNPGPGTLKNVKDWLSNNAEHKLKEAPFSLDTVYEGKQFVCDICVSCPQNSAFNNTLFPDTADQATCHNPHCYQAKKNAQFEISLQEALIDPKVILINDGYGRADALEKKLKADGYVVLQEYEELRKPGISQYHGETDDHFEARKQSVNDDYKEKKKRSVQGFSISSGKYVNILLKKAADVNNKQELSRSTLMADIEQKRKRGRELDAEKVMKRQVDLIKDLPFIKAPDENLDRINMIENNALLCLAWSKAGYDCRNLVRKELDMKRSYGDEFADFDKLLAAPAHIKAYIIRSAIFSSFNSIQPNSLNGAVLNALAKDWSIAEYEKINSEQQSTRERREAKLDQKLKDFDKQLVTENA